MKKNDLFALYGEIISKKINVEKIEIKNIDNENIFIEIIVNKNTIFHISTMFVLIKSLNGLFIETNIDFLRKFINLD